MSNINNLPSQFETFAQARKDGFLAAKDVKDSGRKMVGTFCCFTPSEMVIAAKAVPVGVCGVSEEPIPAAEKVLPRNLCPLIKSSYGHAITDTCPYFYFSDLLIGETTCDGKKKMYEYIIGKCREEISVVEQGEFGADMKVELLNDGPVTILLDSHEIMGY